MGGTLIIPIYTPKVYGFLKTFLVGNTVGTIIVPRCIPINHHFPSGITVGFTVGNPIVHFPSYPKRIFIPHKMPRHQYNIFLDLDSTCIYSLDFATPMEQIEELRQNGLTVRPMENFFWVVERPGLQPFLDFLFSKFNVSVWTAATKQYALWIIDEYITPKDSGRNLEYILWSEHCELCQEKYAAETSKDLSVFWRIFKIPGYSQSNTLILDDNCVKVWDTQECNCLMIRAFDAEGYEPWNDRELERTENHLTKLLSGDFPDVCPVGEGMYTTATEIGEVYGDMREELLSSGTPQTEDDFTLDIDETEISPNDSVSQVG